jgi:hypothetical protein
MSTYKKEKEINHKGAEGARRRVKTKKSGALCSFVRLRGLYFSSLIRTFSPIKALVVPSLFSGSSQCIIFTAAVPFS